MISTMKTTIRSSLICSVLTAALAIGFSAESRAASVTISSLNNSAVGYTIGFNDGAGGNSTGSSGISGVYIGQFNMTYTPDSGPARSIETYCIDLSHSITSIPSTYSVYYRNNVGTTFNTNYVGGGNTYGNPNPPGATYTGGGEMGYIYAKYGAGNLHGNDDQAAAVQIALWALSVANFQGNNITPIPTSFGAYINGEYGNSNFWVKGVDSNVVSLVNSYLVEANTSAAQSSSYWGRTDWLDASAQGTYESRGQSVLIVTPEPTSIALLGTIGFFFGAARVTRRRGVKLES